MGGFGTVVSDDIVRWRAKGITTFNPEPEGGMSKMKLKRVLSQASSVLPPNKERRKQFEEFIRSL